MKILFVYPGIANIGFNAYYERDESPDSWYVPIGLSYLAALVLRDGHEADLMDLRYLQSYDEVDKKIQSSGSDIVALSFQTPGTPYAMEVAKIAKKYKKIVIGGGIHPTIMPRELLQSGFFDHVVVGEGVISFPELVNNLAKGLKPEPLVIGKYVSNLDDVPFPHFFDLYVNSMIKKHKLAMIFTSRGCPGHCNFCQPVANSLFGKKVKFRSADNIISELLEWQKKYGITHFMILDDTFLIKKKLVKEFCRKLIDLKTGLTWQCNARVNEFEEEMIGLMAESGCKWICIGFESGSQRILDLIKKGTTVEQGFFAAELCKKYGMGYTSNILVGVPGETEEDYQMNLDFVKKIEAKQISYNWLVPYPGTDTYEFCKKNGTLNQGLSWEDYEMNRIKIKGIISTVDYERARHWEVKTVYWNENISEEVRIIEEGKLLEIAGEMDKALAKYLMVKNNCPEFYSGYYFSAKIYKGKGNNDLAVQNLKEALVRVNKVKEKNILTSVHFHLGEIFYQQNENELARREFEICGELIPTHQKAEKYLELLNGK